MNPIHTLLRCASAAALCLTPLAVRAGTMSASPDAPAIVGLDIANYATPTGTDKWFAEDSVAGAAKGQTFTTGDTPVLLRSITYQIGSTNTTEPTKEYVIRVGSVSGDTFTEIYSETATQDFTWNSDEYMTWTLDTPVSLDPNTLYGIDVGMTSSTSGWQTGIPYIKVTADEYPDGLRYRTGTSGVGTDTLVPTSSSDRIFHLSLQHPLAPSPEIGAVVPAGDLTLSWTNLEPNTGTDVWVDVWFGTDPENLTKVADAQQNLTSFLVNLPGADTYYWRIDSYLDGAPTGTPLESTLFDFSVFDSDGDGFPDDYELLHTDPPSATDLNREDDRDSDGITNWDEYVAGTNPSLPDTDGDGLLDGDSITVPSSDLRYTEWADANILYTDDGDNRTFLGENARGSDPLETDTDGDGLTDDVETNTGTWIDTNDTGTDPSNADTDGDGLSDGVETNTGSFVDENDAGTNPHLSDTDADGAADWYEVTAALTDPTDPASTPPLPYPLPDPDSSTGATDKPVKVYIMSGQSNMVGFGTVSGTGEDTLETMTVRQNRFPNLVDESGDWTTRQDVRYRGVISDIANAQLSPGNLGSNFGPELGFGYILGWYHDEPVLLLKSSIGNRGLGWDILPSGSPTYQYDGYQYAAYGESPLKWPIGETPEPIGWYAGKEFDRFFMDESEWAHPDTAVTNVVDVLDDFANEYPDWADQGFEIAGFVWWQGDKDRYDMGHATKYEENLVNLIDSLRNYYSNRYPGQVIPDAPFVLATLGQTELGDDSNLAEEAILDAQLAVDGDLGKYPEYAGNVKTVYAHPLSQGGASNGHYNGHAATYMLVGDALGQAMVELLDGETPPAEDFDSWIGGYDVGSQTGPDDDADGDGISNAAENYFGTDPSAFSAGLSANAVSLDGETSFTFSHPMNDTPAADLTAGYRWSTDLAGFHADGASADDTTVSFTVGTPANGAVMVTATITGTVPDKLFVTVDVAQNP